MHWRKYFIPTTKETPKDAVAPSHVLMLRAGLIRQLAAGVYSYLPLGWRALKKVEEIVRAEMDRAGAVELKMPCLTPVSLWEETGRFAVMTEILLRIAGGKDDWRSGLVLGPTHEEIITEIARAYLSSYKQLPINLYQIQAKFRGEARPKSGVLRTREFIMKDAYSFHSDKASLDAEYDNMYRAYCRTFARCGLPYLAVEADSGAMGGDVSHEFMVLTDAGEDLVALSENNDYAANLERATAAVAGRHEGTGARRHEGESAPREVHTPNAGKIDEVCAFLKTEPRRMIKTLVYQGTGNKEQGAAKSAPPKVLKIIALVRGDHEVNEIKLRKAAGVPLELATPELIEEVTGAKVGFAGPQGLIDRIDKLIIDRDVTAMHDAATGANKTDYHVLGVEPGRDFPLSGETVVVADIRNVVDGDLSPTGSGAPIRLRTAIEVGHVFKLGTKYSDSMGATYLGPDGKPQPLIMGCYGIGVTRVLAAVIEAHHDENGIIWPMSVAPYHVSVLAIDPREDEVMRLANQIHDQLEAAGIEVLFDDRDERAGFKFKDADLIGIPVRIVVGKKALAAGGVEFQIRGKPDKTVLPADQAVEKTREFVHAELARLANAT